MRFFPIFPYSVGFLEKKKSGYRISEKFTGKNGDKRMAKKVTLQDIADQIGVTKVSVSKAINNQPGIGESLREQILKTAKQMGYVKVQHTKERKDYKFALICAKRFFLEDETFYTTIYYYINKRCAEKEFALSWFVINDQEEVSGKLPMQLLTESFDGIFIAGEFQKNFLIILNTLCGAKVAIDFYKPDLNMDSVVVDNYYTGFTVANYLIRKGHRHIGFVGSIQDTSSICDRYFGYLKALMLHGLPVRQDWHITNNDYLTGRYSSVNPLPEDLPTAFICHCDKAALILSQQLRERGVRIPEDVSLISFDNTNICNLLSPKLTSVEIDRKQIAYCSVNQMLHRIQHPDAPPQKIYLGSKLIERESVWESAQIEE